MNDDPSEIAPIGEDARIDALDKRLKALRELEEERNRPKATEPLIFLFHELFFYQISKEPVECYFSFFTIFLYLFC